MTFDVNLLVLPDLFSQFDPSVSSLFKLSHLGFWCVCFLLFIPLTPSHYLSTSRLKLFLGFLMSPIIGMSKENNSKRMQGVGNYLAGLFLFIFFVNFSGLMPWTFSGSSQFMLTMSLAVPAWLTTIIFGTSQVPLAKLGEYVGTSIPVSLAPAISLCEIISGLMRPLTLGLRLGANMLAGHVITCLVSNCLIYLIHVGSLWSPFIMVVSMGLYVFEMVVCFIQAYVFVLLLSIYVQESPT